MGGREEGAGGRQGGGGGWEAGRRGRVGGREEYKLLGHTVVCMCM